jgi:hypothetical protein
MRRFLVMAAVTGAVFMTGTALTNRADAMTTAPAAISKAVTSLNAGQVQQGQVQQARFFWRRGWRRRYWGAYGYRPYRWGWGWRRWWW